MNYLLASLKSAWEMMFSGNSDLLEIVATTLRMAGISSVTALLIGAPLGVLLAVFNFPGKRAARTLLRTCMALPPVVVGIALFIMASGTKLVYSVKLMIIAQIVLITPVTAGLTESYLSAILPDLKETAGGLRMSKWKLCLLAANESKRNFIVVYLMAFSRSIAEVGAVQIVGGNILHETRVMTTAIALEYGKGSLSLAVALGIILFAIAFVVNAAAALIQDRIGRS